MIRITEPAERVLDIRLEGIISRDDVREMEAVVEKLLADGGSLSVVIDMLGLDDMTAGALAEDIRFELGLLPQLARFERIAVVSGKEWVRALMNYAGLLMPMVELAVYGPEDAALARDFVLHVDETPEPEVQARGVTLLESAPGMLAFEIDGVLTPRDVEAMKPAVEEALSGGGPVDALVRVRSYAGFTPDLLMQRDVWEMKMALLRQLRRYAVVGAPDWLTVMVQGVAPVMPVLIRSFEADEEQRARDWLAEADAA